MKKFLWVLLGIVIGVAGFYSVTTFGPRILKPDSPSNLAILLKQAVDDNSLYSIKYLMTPEQRDNFTSSDLQSLKQYIRVGTPGEGGTSLDSYLVMTFDNYQAITLFLAPPIGQHHTWQIQRISKGAHVEPASNTR